MSSSEPFTKQMRKVTREIHDISDTLINAKLAIALGENYIWSQGLLCFYEIFKYLEESYLDDKGIQNSLIGQLDIPEMRRTSYFEQDLEFYLGKGWKNGYKPRKSVQNYIDHMKKIQEEDPYLLVPYIYHLYMGLLSGGQILRKKRTIAMKFSFFSSDKGQGLAVTEISGGTVYATKKKIADAMNSIAEELDEETKEKILEESKMVFVLNNEMVNSIDGVGTVVIIKLIKYSMMGFFIAGAGVLIKRMLYPNT